MLSFELAATVGLLLSAVTFTMPAGRWGSSPFLSGVMLKILACSILPWGTFSSARPTDRESARVPAKYLLTVRLRKSCKRLDTWFLLFVLVSFSLSVSFVPVTACAYFFTRKDGLSLPVFCSLASETGDSFISCLLLICEVLLLPLQERNNRNALKITAEKHADLFITSFL